ncbi:uncharacterized protein LOC112091953 [Morus notabilis]|uniref:uncharacterized protein LOC112091953 n=1 Tax=Morus notabilis TaxID=981085 RepID=UPI000CED5653|nr:uncharacterized protein LOC112091953 [Morus notabilis]
MQSPNWSLSFEIMCDAKLLAVVFALDKFRAYLIGSLITIFTDHVALKYLLSKKDAKARLIRWILLLQKFDLTIKDKKGVKNVVADHLSRLEFNDSAAIPAIGDDFPDEHLFAVTKMPWYANIVNYSVTGKIPSTWGAQDKRKFLVELKINLLPVAGSQGLDDTFKVWRHLGEKVAFFLGRVSVHKLCTPNLGTGSMDSAARHRAGSKLLNNLTIKVTGESSSSLKIQSLLSSDPSPLDPEAS